MRYRQFGRAEWLVSEISFGAWQLGGQWGAVDDADSEAALIAAYDAGVNFVDTAEMYGQGRSERIVGRSLKRWAGDKIRVATKVQPTSWPAVADGDPNIEALYPDHHLRDNVEASLRRLDVDCIDLLQLHCWAPSGMHRMEWLSTLHALRDQGKIDKIGVSIRDYRPEDGVELAASGLVDSIQVIYNIFEQRPEIDLFPAAVSSGTAIIARVALDSGALSGTWTNDTFDSWGERSVLRTMFREGRFTETLERVARLRDVTDRYMDSLLEVAIRFVLDPDAVSTTVLGMSNARRLAENLAFSDGVRLPAELRARLAEHAWPRNYYQ